MSSKKTRPEHDRIVADARRVRKQREQTYRERALKMFPWVCGRCGREFSGKKLRELTVHHRDHNHDHNPPDGSNWELLCLYCHDNEHSRYEDSAAYSDVSPDGEQDDALTDRPFANLDALLKNKK
ncbi:MAG: HNH nuclease family protein [Desulfobacterales bacterium]|nr:MAG: HNH nuclease family protein [Desulfobacterales bacterium]